MENSYYQECIEDSARKLQEIHQILFEHVFNIAIAGELNDWSGSCEIGEVHHFSTEIFEGCTDINLKLLTGLMSHVENTFSSICNLNKIDMKDN